MTFAAGLAANGMKPYFAVYSSFLQRAYDNIIHDAALQKLPVKICIDRAGLSDADGATHHGIFDVAFLSHIPNIKIFTPITDHTLRLALKEANELNTPCAIRYPNACENERVVREFYSALPEKLGYAKNYENAEELDCVIITHGRIVTEALKAADELAKEGIKVGIILLEVLKPYDTTAADILDVIPEKPCKILFLEEEIKCGGMGMILSEELKRFSKLENKSLSILATDDTFVERHAGCSLYDDARVSAKYIIDAVKKSH
jgi:1-deoxy-D-xylulose-5-phosphate synthase